MNEFPQNPFHILDPNVRWAPSQEDLQEKAYEYLIPPLVYKIRLAIKEWRHRMFRRVGLFPCQQGFPPTEGPAHGYSKSGD